MGETKVILMVIGVAIGVIAVLAGILVPLSFADLEYYEIGFLRKKSTGEVDTSRIFEGGKYFVGPHQDFKIYSAKAHNVELNNISVFTADKLEIHLNVSLQYFLRKKDLRLLHRQYDVMYEEIMANSALDAIKAAASTFTIREYIGKRISIETALFKAVRERLGGVCCAEDCESSEFACPKMCKPKNLCTTNDKGLFVDVQFFQLGQIQFPSDLSNRYMRALTLQEEAQREMYLQEVYVVQKATESMVKEIQNGAVEIRQKAEGRSKQILTMAEANYTVIVEKARSQALKSLYNRLGITDQEHKNSLDYLLTLRGMDNIHLNVGLKQTIVGNIGTA